MRVFYRKLCLLLLITMGRPLAPTGDGRKLQQEKKFWKCIAIAQFFTILWIVFYVKRYNIVGSENSQIDSGKHESELGHPDGPDPTVGHPENLKTANSKFNSADLEMFQSQTNLELVRDIRENWLQPPSQLPYNITPDTTTDLSAVKRLHKIVLEQLGGKTNGFFIECGAFDGVWLSNTLHLEQEFNWTGLLVEADPKYYGRLATRQRKAWTINACLSIKPHKEKVQMTRMKNMDALSVISEIAGNNFRQRPEAEEFQAQCFPLTSILAALGQPLNIDYLSLDVEGAELKILQTIPWNFVFIKVISLEANEAQMGPLVDFMASKNYEFITHVSGPWIHDHVFVHKQLKLDREFGSLNKNE